MKLSKGLISWVFHLSFEAWGEGENLESLSLAQEGVLMVFLPPKSGAEDLVLQDHPE